MTREPSAVAVLAARIAVHYGHLEGVVSSRRPFTAYVCAAYAESICALERAAKRHAERQCSEESYQGRKSDLVHARLAGILANLAKDLPGLSFELAGDPRGPCLKIKFPGAAEAVAV